MSSLIAPDNIIVVWAFVIGIVFVANWMDQKWKWANKLSIVVLCILGGMILANIKILPFESPVYDGIGSVLLKLAIPMLLFKSDIRKIYRESGRVFASFHIAILSSLTAGILFSFVIKAWPGIGADAQGLTAMHVAGFIGGTVNEVAMADIFNVSPSLVSSATLVGNFNLGFLLFFLAWLTQSKFIRKHFKHPYIDEREQVLKDDPTAKDKPMSAVFWKNREISLLGILQSFFTAFLILALSTVIGKYVKSTNAPFIVKQLLGSDYLLMTTFATLGATFIPQWFSELKFGDEFGMIMLTMWYVTIGTGANIVKILEYGILMVLIFAIAVIIHLTLGLFIANKMKLSFEEACCGIMASIGGPSSSAALTINNGWRALIAPSILVSLYGYIVGNYLGVIMGNLLF